MLTIIYSFFLMILIPIYWIEYGLQNYLWISDIGLFLTFLSLWLKTPLFISMALLGVLPFEIVWTVDYFVRFLSGRQFLNITNYMFDKRINIFIRALSFFHIFVPIIWFWKLYEWGYDARALLWMTVLNTTVLILTYYFTDPQKNINWVFTPLKRNWSKITVKQWLILMLILIPILVLIPLHFLFTFLFKN